MRPSNLSSGKRSRRRLAILLLCDDHRGQANTLRDHVHAFPSFSRHRVRLFNPRGLPRVVLLNLDEFDAILIHYSLDVTIDSYLSAALRSKLAEYRGLKIVFLQDEYRAIDRVTRALRDLRIDMVFSAAGETATPILYEDRLPGVCIVPTLTGFVPERLTKRSVPRLGARRFDVGYRGRQVPYWLGRLGQEKLDIGRSFLRHAGDSGLRCDIAWREEDRLYGESWNRFLASCRATLGTGSGASIADFDGSLERGVDEYVAQRPDASFEEVHAAVLAPHEGNVVIDVISPRVFEAAALRTPLVLFPGPYSGVVSPWTHYIPLEKDFSNVSEVLERLRDLPFLEQLAMRTYTELAASGRYSYETFIRDFDERVEELASAPRGRLPIGYNLTRLESRVFRWRLRLRMRARFSALIRRVQPLLAGDRRR